MSSIRVNSLYDIVVFTDRKGDHTYMLLDSKSGTPVSTKEAGSAYTSSEESMVELGRAMMREHLTLNGKSLVYAVGIMNRGGFAVKWWYEMEARDTTYQFTQQTRRPEMQWVSSFEFIVPEGTSNGMVEVDAAAKFSVVAYGVLAHPEISWKRYAIWPNLT